MQIRIDDVVTMPGRACEGKVRSAAIAPGRYEVAVVEWANDPRPFNELGTFACPLRLARELEEIAVAIRDQAHQMGATQEGGW